MDTNVFTCVGRIVSDPKPERTVGTGSKVSTFRIVINGRTDKDTVFIDVDGWNRTSEIIQNLAKKGRRVHVLGKLKIDKFKGSNGEPRELPKIWASEIIFIDPPENSDKIAEYKPQPKSTPTRAAAAEAREEQENNRERASRMPPPPPSRPPTQSQNDEIEGVESSSSSTYEEEYDETDDRAGLPPRPSKEDFSDPDEEIPF